MKVRLGRAFAIFQSAVLSSDLADGVYKTVVPLLVLTIDRSAFGVALVGAAVRLPYLVATLPAGVLADRVQPIVVMRAASAVRLLFVAALIPLTVTHGLTLWTLAALAFFIGCAGTLVDVAAQSQLARLVPLDVIPRANSVLQTIQLSCGQLAAPALGGVAIALSTDITVWSVAGLYLATLALLGWVPRHVQGAMAADLALERRNNEVSVVQELATGLKRLFERRDLVGLAVIAAANNLAYAWCLTMLPLWVVAPGPLAMSSVGYGVLLAALAVGGIASGILAPRLLPLLGDMRVLRLGVPVIGVCFIAIAVPSPIVVGIALVTYGIVSMLWNVVVVSYRQRTIPPEIFGRVNSAYRWLTWGVIPIGSVLGGVISAYLGLTLSFIIAGLIPLIAGLIVGVTPVLRSLSSSTHSIIRSSNDVSA
ncbi:MFS transporter [Pseudarthrobacter oxydans]|uniref:MFS transporter n=1 Tax=Pseudarthrobacter oxydans TaxID=1671 RepID=UPI00341531B5